MDILLRFFFLILAIAIFVFILSLIFSIFLIVWPFLLVGTLAAMAYRWYMHYTGKEPNFYWQKEKKETIIIIEHEEKKEE